MTSYQNYPAGCTFCLIKKKRKTNRLKHRIRMKEKCRQQCFQITLPTLMKRCRFFKVLHFTSTQTTTIFHDICNSVQVSVDPRHVTHCLTAISLHLFSPCSKFIVKSDVAQSDASKIFSPCYGELYRWYFASMVNFTLHAKTI